MTMWEAFHWGLSLGSLGALFYLAGRVSELREQIGKVEREVGARFRRLS